MPRKSSRVSVADEQAAPGGAAAVDRAISLLAAFRAGDSALGVNALAERTRLYRSTVLRLLASLAHGGLVRRTAEGQWTLGPEVARLAAVHAASFSLEDVVLPEMRALSNAHRRAWPSTSRRVSSGWCCFVSTPRSCCATTSGPATCCRWTAVRVGVC